MSDVLLEPIQHKLTLNPVTALAFLQVFNGPLLLLVGEGYHVKVYDTETSKLIAQFQIFKTQTIHGITVQGSTSPESSNETLAVVVWGGRSFVCLSQRQLLSLVQGTLTTIDAREEIVSDWILYATLNHYSDNNALIITAHNAALNIAYQGNLIAPNVQTLVPSSQAILYSAHAVWENATNFMVAGGSVFGDITVHSWENGINILICTLTGHEGSIFGLHISDPVYNPEGFRHRVLASCSDDRTVRLWSLVNDDTSIAAGPDAPKDTGFGNSAHQSGSEEPERLIAVVMGHASRIWGVRIVASFDQPSNINILSFGEDATCQQWWLSSWESLRGMSPTKAILNHVDTHAYHTGKHIWASAVQIGPDAACNKVATGGADGSVVIYDVHHYLEPENIASIKSFVEEDGLSSRLSTQKWIFLEPSGGPHPDQIEDDSANVREEPVIDETISIGSDQTLGTAIAKPAKKAKKPPKPQEDAIKRYAFLSREEILVTTAFGRVMRRSIGPPPGEWQELHLSGLENLDLRSYSLVIGVPELGIAFLVGANGFLCQCQGDKISEVVQVDGKPAALLHITSSDKLSTQLLITTLGNNVATILSFDISSSLAYKYKTELQLPENFVVTSAGDIDGTTILGSRNGSVAAYNQKEGDTKCVATLQAQAHPNGDAVTSIIPVPQFNQASYRSHFVATNRNGTYSVVSLTREGFIEDQLETVPLTTLNLVHQSSPPLSVIEHAWFDEGKLFFYGFRSKSFIVWNETDHFEITNVYCGGSHRNYSYLPTPGAGGAGHFAYTKASSFYMHTQTEPSHKVVKPGAHGREIKASSILQSDDVKWVATGSEDTNIQIFQYLEDSKDVSGISRSLKCLAVIEQHSSGIQALKWDDCYDDEKTYFLFSASGAEEFNIWRISSIPSFGLGVVLESSLPRHYQTPDRDLRITDFIFERFRLSPRRLGALKLITWRFTLTYSDSTIRSFLYEKSKGWILVAEGRYGAACLTQILPVRRELRSVDFLTASTDGHIAFWRLPNVSFNDSLLTEWPSTFGVFDPKIGQYGPPYTTETPQIELVTKMKLHQSNISAMDVLHLMTASEGYLLATGGDDNALCLTYFVTADVPSPSETASSITGSSSGTTPAPIFYPHNTSPQTEITIQNRLVIPSAHASTITGLSFHGDVTGGMREDQYLRIWSTSSDQSLKRWTIEVYQPHTPPFDYATMPVGYSVRIPKPPLKFRVRELDVDGLGMDGGRAVTSVPDAAGVVSFNHGWEAARVLVFGAGIQVFGVGYGFPPVGRDRAWD